jgi:hypothetical protein
LVGGLPVLSTVAHLGRGEPTMGSRTVVADGGLQVGEVHCTRVELGDAEPGLDGAELSRSMRGCPWRRKNPKRRDDLWSPASSWPGLTCRERHQWLMEEVCPVWLLQIVVQRKQHEEQRWGGDGGVRWDAERLRRGERTLCLDDVLSQRIRRACMWGDRKVGTGRPL